jgi:SWI/SNF-related matrix-associated actin-dependent regulator 1 of chromatin subfamily A
MTTMISARLDAKRTHILLTKTPTAPLFPASVHMVGRVVLRTINEDGTADFLMEICAYNIWVLRKIGAELSSDLDALYRKFFNLVAVEHREIAAPKGDGLSLLPYQVDGIRFMEKRRGRVLLADEMGLGKSLQVIGWLATYPEFRPAIIVCPAHLKWNWKGEFEKFYGSMQVEVLSGMRPYRTLGQILIISYTSVAAWVDYFLAIKADTLVCDEAHFAKNMSAGRTAACRRLARECKHVLLLSGTPLENNVLEVHGLASMVDPHVLGTHYTFKQEYASYKTKAVKRNGVVERTSTGKVKTRKVVDGAKSMTHLYKVLSSTIMIRRKKKDVLPQLPPKRHHLITFQLTGKEYAEAERVLMEKVQGERDAVLTQTEQFKYLRLFASLRQVAAKARLTQSCEWIESFLEESDGKLIVIAHHKIIISELRRRFPDSLLIDGSVGDAREKQRVANEFQTGTTRIIFGEINSIGTGYTLTAASDVLFCELSEKPSTLDQAADRMHRIGQIAEYVDIWYHVAKDTIEEDLMAFLDKKRTVARGVLDGEKVEDEEMLLYLMNKAEQRYAKRT